ncbi:282f4994-03e0-448e-988b-2b86319ce220 [Thermothielavioides terrestris]|uniref:282f4994-03e0-448e-988b-2b86319ce220 n=1 Tax=Thermothielavioides terrestris TaxID=2587410 RepID=A0A446BTN8_9PEZI|nr:282f4994-03e0-448e-988b-2b86319ce220 [Thermothielavioides terrestris]
MPPPGVKKPTLPFHLLKELGVSDSRQGQRRGAAGGQIASRKERRKAERKQGKANRTAATRDHAERTIPIRKSNARQAAADSSRPKHGQARNGPKSILKKGRPDPTEDEQESKNFDDTLEEDDSQDLLSDGVLDEGSDDEGEESAASEDADFGDDAVDAPPKRSMSKTAKAMLAQDDAEIAELERKLGLKNRKKLPKSFRDDGLGDLLDGLGGGFDEEQQEKRKRKAEADEWLAQKRRKAEAASSSGQQSRLVDESADDSGDSDDLDEDMEGFDEDDDLEDADSDDHELDEEDVNGGDQGESQDSFEGSDSEDEEAAEQPPQRRIRENPYVAPTTGQTAKYVPPSLRKESGSDAELEARIRRQTQGLVNRITESNMLTILAEIEKLYREYPRQHVTSSLVDLLLIQVCDPTSLPDTLLILTAGFATAAYMVLGNDFGGQLIQEVVVRFEKYYEEAKAAAVDRPDVPKQTSNLITFISQLYTFQLIGSNLVFDYIRMLLESLSELNAELLLRVVRMCGPTLRQDDPMALKDIVSLIPPAVAKAGEKNLTVRTKFMIDTITDLKNNKMKAGAGASAVISEHITRMKKMLGQLKSRKLKSTEPMRMGLKDIQDADKRGKWWLVGASWAGRSAGEQQGASKPTSAQDDKSDDESILLDDVEQGPDLAELAREQGMNTEVRRSIFVSIMSAMDYQDAYARILKLRLNKERQREIPNVIIRCVGAEQYYNPYYTLVARRLCSELREVRWAFQSCLWKLFGRMGEPDFGEDEAEDEEEDESMDTRRIVNTAKMFGALIAGGSLGVTVLKRLNLLYLQKKTRDFVEVMLVTVLLECQGSERAEESTAKVFAGAEAAPDLARGLQYFLKKVVRKSDLAGGKKNAKLLKEGCKMAEAVVQTALARAEDLA